MTNFEQYTLTMDQFTKSKLFRTKYDSFMNILPHDKSRSKSGFELAKALEISECQVRKLCSYARAQGKPICSGEKGYWITHDRNEMKSTLDHLKQRCYSLQFTIKKIEESINETPRARVLINRKQRISTKHVGI